MSADVEVPAVGSVPKPALYAAGAFLVGFVGYAYYKRRKDAAAAAAAAAAAGPVDNGFNTSDGAGGTLPTVPGNALGGYGIPTIGNQATTPAGAIVTNQDWTQAVRDRLAGTYADADIVAACGLFLNGQPLSSQYQTIIQGAIAVAGYPPVGDIHILTGGGNVSMLVAPTNVRGVSVTQTGCELVWDAVPGAASYYLYDGTYPGTPHTRTVTDPQCDVVGRPAGSVVGPVYVTAVSASGQESPRSAAASVQLDAATPAPQPQPQPTPQPTPQPQPQPAPQQPAYPTYWTSHTNVAGDSYAKIAQEYGLNISGQELYDYQFSSEAGRPASTQATLRQRGPNLIYAGGETEIPYPRR